MVDIQACDSGKLPQRSNYKMSQNEAAVQVFNTAEALESPVLTDRHMTGSSNQICPQGRSSASRP